MNAVIRVIFDCNTFLQGLAAPDGPAGQCVQFAMNGKVQLFVSPFVLSELRNVSSQPSVVKKLHLVLSYLATKTSWI